MQQLSKKILMLPVIAVAVMISSLVGALANSAIWWAVSLSSLTLLLTTSVILLSRQLDRIANQQKRTRQEIYSVLYSLHGTEKRLLVNLEETTQNLSDRCRSLEHGNRMEARKTRQHFLRNTKSIISDYTADLSSKIQRSNRKIDGSIENQRLQSNRLIAILDAHWELHTHD